MKNDPGKHLRQERIKQSCLRFYNVVLLKAKITTDQNQSSVFTTRDRRQELEQQELEQRGELEQQWQLEQSKQRLFGRLVKRRLAIGRRVLGCCLEQDQQQ